MSAPELAESSGETLKRAPAAPSYPQSMPSRMRIALVAEAAAIPNERNRAGKELYFVKAKMPPKRDSPDIYGSESDVSEMGGGSV
ncbi:hypothetical protein JCM24511_01056 [Saitozyma sp. JCM 24511]|nr:hypothetical protein JCM24511_01056 [Saitozyma sp. JCM 24511]